MQIHTDTPLRAQGLSIAPGDYEVAVQEGAGLVRLTSDTQTHRLEATQRSSKVEVESPSAQMRQVAGEPRCLLIVRTPPATEWVVSLDRA
jgi:hypothetical protein